jgi:hippurate hydrolase
MREDLAGAVWFVFQPSEERLPGGAKVMLDEGALDARPDAPAPAAIFGQHVMPNLPAGTIGVRPGPFMASADEIYLTVRGKGGHAAAPHLLVDPVLAQAHVLTALQAVISRSRPAGEPSILSFGRVIGDGAGNVVPDEVRIDGTFRAMDDEWRFRAHDLIRRTAEHAAAALGASCDVDIRVGYPTLTNDEALTSTVRAAALDYAGRGAVVDLPAWYASEDFAWYTQRMPGSFYVLGTGDEAAGITAGLHTPRFTVAEEALRLGTGFMAYLAWRSGEEG